PDKLAAEVRKSHFEEIYQPFTPEQAQQQAARCRHARRCSRGSALRRSAASPMLARRSGKWR
ncbi:hypothetical protein CKQ90_30175, partial [Klebsiella pneumoniae]